MTPVLGNSSREGSPEQFQICAVNTGTCIRMLQVPVSTRYTCTDPFFYTLSYAENKGGDQ
jgi:hypothetical protein